MKSKQNTMKRRIFLLQGMLYDLTDEQHPVSSFEILKFLEEHGSARKRVKLLQKSLLLFLGHKDSRLSKGIFMPLIESRQVMKAFFI